MMARRGFGGRRHGLYIPVRLFEAVFGPISGSFGNTKHNRGHGNPEASYEGWDRRGGRYSAPQGRRRNA